MKPYLKILLLFIILIAPGYSLQAQNLPEPMSPPRLVNDFAGIFSEEQKADLEQMLRTYNDTTSTQIYVVTVNDLQGYAASDFAPRLGEKWGIGQKSKNNGAIILIKPKTANSRGDIFIATGYGLEEKLTDGRIGRIIDNDMLPYFKENDYYGGTKAGIETMMKYLAGQFQADEDDTSTPPVAILIILVVAIIFLFSIFNNGKGGRGGKISPRRGFFPPMGGGGNFGGGGSFGGGGGGSFGGGGAGRSW